MWLWPDAPRPLGGDRNKSKLSHYYCTWLTKGMQSTASSRAGRVCFLEVAAAAELIGCVEESLTPCHHLLRHLAVLMRWSTEWGIDCHLFRQHLSAECSHRTKKKKKNGLRSSLTVGYNAAEATSSYCIWQRGNSCNLFLVRVNNFWMWQGGQAEAALCHLGLTIIFWLLFTVLSSGFPLDIGLPEEMSIPRPMQ